MIKAMGLFSCDQCHKLGFNVLAGQFTEQQHSLPGDGFLPAWCKKQQREAPDESGFHVGSGLLERQRVTDGGGRRFNVVIQNTSAIGVGWGGKWVRGRRSSATSVPLSV